MFGEKDITIKTDQMINDEIMGNIKNILLTPSGTVPLDRNYGISQDFISFPSKIAKNIIALEMKEKIEKYEPRAEVTNVKFGIGEDGTLLPIIQINIKEMEDVNE